MPELQRIKRRRESTLTLLNLVKNVKALAAVTIREQQAVATALMRYEDTLEQALGVVVHEEPGRVVTAGQGVEGPRTARIVFGTDQGMCGAFNQRIARIVSPQVEGPLVVVGYRAGRELEKLGHCVQDTLGVPNGSVGSHRLVGRILVFLKEWQDDLNVGSVELYLNVSEKGSEAFTARRRPILPLGRDWLERLQAREWESRSRPVILGDQDEVFQTLLRQWLYVTVYRALADSLVAESAARLSTMQNAESNIQGKLEILDRDFRSLRQSQIDAEILDISAGFEAVTGGQ